MLQQLKEQYNTVIDRYNKAEQYFASDASREEKEQFIPQLQEVINILGGLIRQIRIHGHEMTSSEILEGFKFGGD